MEHCMKSWAIMQAISNHVQWPGGPVECGGPETTEMSAVFGGCMEAVGGGGRVEGAGRREPR